MFYLTLGHSGWVVAGHANTTATPNNINITMQPLCV